MFLRQIAVLSLAATACFAQQYEIGGSAGAGFARNATITNATGSAAAGLKSGAAFGGWIGHRMYPRMSGEIRYSFMRQDLMLCHRRLRAGFYRRKGMPFTTTC